MNFPTIGFKNSVEQAPRGRFRNSGKATLAILLGLVFALANPSVSRAQALYGSINGNVTDPSGAAITGADVSVINVGTGQGRETRTGAAGAYGVARLEAGVYQVRVSADGFQSFTQTNVRVTVNSAVRVDAELPLGAVTESVTVDAGAVRLQTEQSEVRYEVDSFDLENLPVPVGRNYQHTLRLLPGVNVSGGGAIRASNPAGSLAMNVNGTSQQVSNTRIDGASSTNNFHQHLAAYVPTLESIETLEAVTSTFDADQGLAGGAAINVNIKSGTNEVHGSAFEYHTNNHIKARPYFFPAAEEKPRYIFNQFGGTIGGPIKKNKLFYFLSYEGATDRTTYSRFVTAPTPAAKSGDLSESARPIYDPLTGAADGSGRELFPDNQIPRSRQSAISQKILPLWPDPNIAGLANNFFAAAVSPYNRNTVDAKVNYMASSKLSVWSRIGILGWDSFYPTVFGSELGGRTVSGQQSGLADGATYSLTLAGSYVWTPTLIVDGYFGYNRGDQNVRQERLDENVGLDFLGIPGTNGPRRIEGGWPRIQIDGYDTIGINEPYMPWFREDPGQEYVVNFNWTRGAHNLRFGGDFAQRALNHAQPEVEGQYAGGAGGFRFRPGVTEVRGAAAGDRANSFAAFLLGLPQQMGRTLQVPDVFTLHSVRHSYYVGDRWNVTPRLTLNFGLRWELFPFPTRADRGVEFYNPLTNEMSICGLGSVPEDCGVEVPNNGWAPRLGLAYRISDTFVVRAGYGLSNDPFDIGPRGLRTNYPVLVALNIDGANAHDPAGGWEDGLPPVPEPDLGDGVIPTPLQVVVHSVPTKIERGYIQSWNLTLQKELSYGFVGQAGYVATRSVRQYGNIDINAGQIIGAGNAGRPLVGRFGRTATTSEYRPFGHSQYDALQASLTRRFDGGFQMGMNYTWSKTIGVNSDSQSGVSVAALQYFDLNRSLVGYDRTHIFNLTNVWELPFGRGKRWASESKIASAILGGWQINNVVSLLSGSPFSVTASGTSLDMPGSTQRADQVKPEVEMLGGAGPGQSYFDPFAFAAVTEPRFGTAGFNTLRGPGIVNWDFGLFRQFALGERWRIEFRAEAFNFTNTPHFGDPGANVSSMSFNADGSIRSLGGFSEITSINAGSLGRGGADERAYRLGLRLSF